MSATIQLFNHQISAAEKMANETEGLTSLAPEQRLRRAFEYIAQLQAEVRTLRAELARTERSLEHRDQLLRNALLREQELRAELVKGIF